MLLRIRGDAANGIEITVYVIKSRVLRQQVNRPTPSSAASLGYVARELYKI